MTADQFHSWNRIKSRITNLALDRSSHENSLSLQECMHLEKVNTLTHLEDQTV
jgi:hypothetical protein